MQLIRVRWLRALALLLPIVLMVSSTGAQQNHGEGHYDYLSWASKKTGNCCNNQDCGALNESEWRETTEGTQVKVLGEWCPVLQEHLIIRGKSPDWTKAHACINKNVNFSASPCQRLLCFAGTPKS